MTFCDAFMLSLPNAANSILPLSARSFFSGGRAEKAFCVLLLCISQLSLVGCGGKSTGTATGASVAKIDVTQAKYVGRDSCVKCHAEQAKSFAGSHHDHAMQRADDDSVLADFNDATLEHHGIVSRMFRRDGKFIVHTEGPDGAMKDFEVQYVFGLEPLQQYMVELPNVGQTVSEGAVPRVQVLRLCWNTEKKQWFYLPPPDVPEKMAPSDDLHWTGIAQRWNTMCAECHSTDFQKNFTVPDSHTQLVSAKIEDFTKAVPPGDYESTFFEIDVSCEACHGPGSVHVELAGQWFPGWSRERGYGLADLKATAENQIQACAPCHSRRNVVAAGFRAGNNYYDHYTNQLLTAGIYYPDGQILDEDYVHGSFIQSKMYHKGIRCSDCHDPHSARLKHDGNAVCTSCHQHPTAKYDSVSHHFHKIGSEGAMCVNCHMPSTTYMAVDARRDHSLRIPRPDLSLKMGTPNACTGCHLDKNNVAEEKRDALVLYQDWMLAARGGDQEVAGELLRANQWCDEACEKWYGETRFKGTHFGEAIYAAQTFAPESISLVTELLQSGGERAPALARATALQELANIAPAQAAELAEKQMDDAHPLVRAAAAGVLVSHPNENKAVKLLEAALTDPIRSVRVEAARNLLYTSSKLWSGQHSAAFRKALGELTDGLEYSSDRSGAHMSLGILAQQQGRSQQSIKHYKDAVAVEPLVTGPRTNLAGLLETSLAQQSASASVQQSLADEIKRLRFEEMRLLERDVNLLPSSAALQYRFGLALYLNRESMPDALAKSAKHLVEAAMLEPNNPQYAQGAAMILESLEDYEQALQWAERAVRMSGGDQSNIMLYQQIRSKYEAASDTTNSGATDAQDETLSNESSDDDNAASDER